jgi:RimJ/RimL family protein N-acetyltransferase
MTVEIVPITDDYIEGFCEAVASVSRERHYLATFDGFSLDSARTFVMNNRLKKLPHYVALSAEKVVGWCDIFGSDRPVFQHMGTLGIGLLKPYRGQGIGEHLIRQTLAAAKELGLVRIELTVRETNVNAIALYKKVGFEIEGVLRKATYVDGVYTNSIAMSILFE